MRQMLWIDWTRCFVKENEWSKKADTNSKANPDINLKTGLLVGAITLQTATKPVYTDRDLSSRLSSSFPTPLLSFCPSHFLNQPRVALVLIG